MVRPCSGPAGTRSWQGGAQDKEQTMSQKLDASPAVIGIDIGKNWFHIIGQNQRGGIVTAAEVVTRPGGNATRQPAAVLDRHGGLRRRASPQSQAANAWPRRPLDAGEIRAPLFEGTEE